MTSYHVALLLESRWKGVSRLDIMLTALNTVGHIWWASWHTFRAIRLFCTALAISYWEGWIMYNIPEMTDHALDPVASKSFPSVFFNSGVVLGTSFLCYFPVWLKGFLGIHWDTYVLSWHIPAGRYIDKATANGGCIYVIELLLASPRRLCFTSRKVWSQGCLNSLRRIEKLVLQTRSLAIHYGTQLKVDKPATLVKAPQVESTPLSSLLYRLRYVGCWFLSFRDLTIPTSHGGTLPFSSFAQYGPYS